MTLDPCFVRLADSNDVPRILGLYAELDEAHVQHHPDFYPAGGVAREVSWIESSLADPQIAVFVAGLVATGSSTVAGFVRIVDVQTPPGGILAPRRFGLVDDLVVAAAARRHGLATALLRAAEDWARERGLKALEVTVWGFNLPAQDLYQNAGFSVLRQYLRKTLGE